MSASMLTLYNEVCKSLQSPVGSRARACDVPLRRAALLFCKKSWAENQGW